MNLKTTLLWRLIITLITRILDTLALSTEDNLVSFKLSSIIRDQRDVCVSSQLVEIFEHQLEIL